MGGRTPKENPGVDGMAPALLSLPAAMSTLRAWLCPLMLVLAGCEGFAQLGTGTDATQRPSSCSVSSGPAAGRSPIRRLNREEYANTVRDLLSSKSPVVKTFPLDEEKLGFTNNADALAISGLLVQQYMNAAEALAAEAVTHLSDVLPCVPATVGEDACAKQFITQFGGRAFRRPLSAEESQRFVDLYTEGKKDGFASGISLVIEGMLQSPNFLYRVERGRPAQANSKTTLVTSYEMASRLSYFVWGTMPDKALFDRAAADELSTPAQLQAEVRRMLPDPRARESVARFQRQWLAFGDGMGISKDTALFPQWNSQLQADLHREISTFADHVFNVDGRIETLLTAPYTFVNARLAAFYGLPAQTGEEFVRVELPGGKRGGVLTQGALMATLSYQTQTSPIHRGKFVREHLLCQELPLPAPQLAAQIKPPEVTGAMSTRDRFAQHSSNASCSGCHSLMDPIGVAFEHFDPIGRWRDKDGAFDVKDDGKLIGTLDVDGPVNGPVDLGAKLASSSQVHECVVKEWFRYANGRAETDLDACTVETLVKGFDADGHDMRELMVKMAASDAFRYRSTEGGGE